MMTDTTKWTFKPGDRVTAGPDRYNGAWQDLTVLSSCTAHGAEKVYVKKNGGRTGLIYAAHLSHIPAEVPSINGRMEALVRKMVTNASEYSSSGRMMSPAGELEAVAEAHQILAMLEPAPAEPIDPLLTEALELVIGVFEKLNRDFQYEVFDLAGKVLVTDDVTAIVAKLRAGYLDHSQDVHLAYRGIKRGQELANA